MTTTADIIPGSLIYIKSKGETTFPLESPRVIVGSAAENDIVLKRPKVSRVHARFDCDDRGWTVSDEESVVGTLVNGEPVQQRRLAHGDEIVIGAATLRFELAAGAEAAPPEDAAAPDIAATPPVAATASERAPDTKPDPEVRTVPVDNETTGETTAPIPALVQVRPKGSRRPLFLVAAGYSDVARYAHLLPYLHDEQPLYVLQVPRVQAVAQPADALEFLAAHYIERMREVQADGPFQVAGYNVGGIVAYEVAQQILCVGDRVSALILIDTPFPAGNPLPSLGYRNAQTLNQINQQLMAPLAGLGGLSRQMAAPLAGLGKRLESLGAPQMQRMGGDYATFMAALADPGFETNLTLTQSYKPAAYPGRAVLIQAQDSPVRYANTLWDWSQKVRNGLESRLIEGSYASILSEPDVRGLATQIAACLEDD